MPTPASPEKPRVLIVDDTPANLHVLAEALSGEHEVLIANNGERGLALANRENLKPHLILLDVMMPGLSGFDVCRRLKENEATRDIPVIFVTARDGLDDEARGLTLGAVDYVAKPIHLPIALARIRNHIALKIKADLLDRYANLDGLTDIPNRRRFDEALNNEWRRAVREQRPISLLLADVDHFKQYNDNYGHGEGDACLRRIALALREVLSRPGDLAARYGGEEFAGVLPATDLDGALGLCEELRLKVAGLAIPHRQNPPAGVVTISIGCVTAWPRRELAARKLLDIADTMLYEAKAAGRDRVRGILLEAGRACAT